MKKVLILGAGGVAGIGMTRCLNKDYEVYGHDQSDWAKQVMQAQDESTLKGIFADLEIPVPDSAVAAYVTLSGHYLPSPETVRLCQDKAACAKVLGNLAPKTYWVRDTHGAGGAGAQMASEFLPGRNYSCELLYWHGELLGHFIKERLAYDLKGSKEPTHQRGSSAVSVCIDSRELLGLAVRATGLVAGEPHGVFAVDFKENEQGEPKITEINAGRFLTASYVYYYSTGYNLPLLMVKKFFGEDYELGEYPEGTMVIRQVDSLPKVVVRA